MKRFKKSIVLYVILITAFFNLTCFDMYNDIWDDNASDKYRLAVLGTSNFDYSRIFLMEGDSKITEKWNSFQVLDTRKGEFSDINKDGNIDLILANYNWACLVWYGDGKGSFNSGININVIFPVSDIAVADFDNNGYNDTFIVTDNTDSSIHLVLNINGNPDAASSAYSKLTNHSIKTVSYADFDNDGDLDIVTGADGGDLEFQYWENDFASTGDFTPSEINVGSGVVQVTDSIAADFDNDGDIDVMLVSNGNGYVIMKNNGNAVFTEEYHNIAGPFSGAASGDLDGDGDIDIYISDSSFNPDTILINDGKGNFSVLYNQQQVSNPQMSYAVGLGDMDMDGDIDAVVSTNSGIYIYKNNGKGIFTGTVSIVSGANASSIKIGSIFK